MQGKMLDLSAIRFLVVDDDDYMRAITVDILRALGAQLITSVDGATEAFSMLSSFQTDIIITDWMMEPVDGIALTRMTRTSEDSANKMTPIIMLTSFSEKGRVAEGRDAGVTEFMVKPISPASLYSRIAEIISKPRQFVQTETFFGPDRHRHADNFDTDQKRREDDENDSPESADSDDEDVSSESDGNESSEQ